MSRHDSHYEDLANPGRRGVAPAETDHPDWRPTNGGKNKVYFEYQLGAHPVIVECDLSPDFKLDSEYKLVQGHVRGRCPMPDCEGWWHAHADRKTIYCWPLGQGRAFELGPEGTWVLPTLSIVQAVRCPYNFRVKGPEGREPCSWRATIQNGVARDSRG